MVTYKHNEPYYKLKLDNIEEEKLKVLSFEGEESISELFNFKIELLSDDPEIDSEKILNQKATFTITRGDEDPILIHGIIAKFEQRGKSPDYVSYYAVLVPKVWRLNLTFRNVVYQFMDIKELVSTVLNESGLSGSDFKFELTESYPQLEYVVQYRETNLNFIKRKLEHFGIFFYFDHSGDNDVIVFTDSNDKLKQIDQSEDIYYNPNKDPLSENETISELTCSENIVTGTVKLKDYNYMFPEKELMGESKINSDAPGVYYDFGDNFQDEKEAKSLAKIRNQEILARSKIFSGVSDCRLFIAGYRFKMGKHYRDSWNTEYVIVSLNSKGSQQGLFGILPPGKKIKTTYENYFAAIPAEINYRPVRKTPIPKVSGIMSAKIESGSGDEYAFMDEQGRYRAKTLFDLSDNSNGEASMPIRLSQPYSGAGYGIHFPNHENTELVWACVDGNVDRPVGLATVPNPSNSSPSTSNNKSQSVIRTAGQNELTFDDKTGSENIYLFGTKDQNIEITNDRNKSVGNNQTEQIGVNKSISVGGNHDESIGGNLSQTITIAKTTTIGGAFQISVGAAMNETVGAAKAEEVGAAKAVSVGGNNSENVGANKSVEVGKNISYRAGKKYMLQAAENADLKFGKSTNIQSGEDLTISGGKKAVIDIKDQLTIKCGKASLILKKNGDIQIKGNKIDLKGSGNITIKGKKILEN